jgi:hypothetical protein
MWSNDNTQKIDKHWNSSYKYILVDLINPNFLHHLLIVPSPPLVLRCRPQRWFVIWFRPNCLVPKQPSLLIVSTKPTIRLQLLRGVGSSNRNQEKVSNAHSNRVPRHSWGSSSKTTLMAMRWGRPSHAPARWRLSAVGNAAVSSRG